MRIGLQFFSFSIAAPSQAGLGIRGKEEVQSFRLYYSVLHYPIKLDEPSLVIYFSEVTSPIYWHGIMILEVSQQNEIETGK